MILEEQRMEVAEHCATMRAIGLSPGTSGNLSVLCPAEGLVAVSPSAMRYEDVRAEDVVVVDMEGAVVDGARRPSSETQMHLGCYRRRSDLGAVVHTHSAAATTLAVLGWDLPAVHYAIALSGSAVVRCATYHSFGSGELASAAADALGSGYACLLENHGVLAAGPDLTAAFGLAEQIEFCAGLYLRAKAVGEPHILSDAQIAEVIARFARYEPQR